MKSGGFQNIRIILEGSFMAVSKLMIESKYPFLFTAQLCPQSPPAAGRAAASRGRSPLRSQRRPEGRARKESIAFGGDAPGRRSSRHGCGSASTVPCWAVNKDQMQLFFQLFLVTITSMNRKKRKSMNNYKRLQKFNIANIMICKNWECLLI